MKRALILVLATALAIASVTTVATAAQRFRVIVPVEIDNLPAAVQRGRITCNVASTPAFDPTRSLGSAEVEFAIEGGRYNGRIAVDIIPGGAPVGVDPTTEGRSYSCSLFLMYQCSRPTGGVGWCITGSGGRVRDGAHPAVHTMFATDPARPPAGTIQGTIDRASATTLPMRSL